MRSRPSRSLVACLIASTLLLGGCSRPRSRNVLLIVADDIGVDSLAMYPDANDAAGWPQTPILDYLASSGVTFENVWSSPTCTPTRAAILTGRYGTRTGVTGLVSPTSGDPLPLDEVTIPQILSRLDGGAIRSAAFGKWHLANSINGGPEHPNRAGFPEFRGQLFNLPPPLSYFDWPKLVNGKTTRSRAYVTTDNVDEASAWIRAQRDPWFVYLAFNAAHWPWEVPPHDLLPMRGEGLPKAGTSCGAPCRHAMIEAMDHEIGRLLYEIGPAIDETTVIFIADNGTPPLVQPKGSPYPADRGSNRLKGSLYEGGIHVPLIVSGPTVSEPGSRSQALVDVTDVFATVIELMAGRPIDEVAPDLVLDSTSLVPILHGQGAGGRAFAFAVGGDHTFAIRDDRYKLIRTRQGDVLYDLADSDERFSESNDLLQAPLDPSIRARYERLQSWLEELSKQTTR